MIKKRAFDFKILKNLDFVTMYKNQMDFIYRLMKKLMIETSEKYFTGQLEKLNLNRKNASLLQDIQYFIE